jgi:hypothetical protein
MELWIAAIAVIGTLLGALVSGKFAERAARRTEAAARDEQRRRARTEAVANLAEAISAHRSLMWHRGDAVLKGASEAHIADLSVQIRQSRAQITQPMVALSTQITDPAVAMAANRMVDATFAMRDADTSREDLDQARSEAKDAYSTFVAEAVAYFARTA